MNFDLNSLQIALNTPRFWIACVALFFFFLLYNTLVDVLGDFTKDNAAILVVGGVVAVLIGYGLAVSFGGSVLALILFACAGIPMIAGEYRRRWAKHNGVSSDPVQIGYTSGQLVDSVIMRLGIIIAELRPITNRKFTVGDTELCQRVATSIDQAHQGIAELKEVPRARTSKKGKIQ